MLMLILFWISQSYPVTLMIHELVFSGDTVLSDSKNTELGIGNQEECVPTTISGGGDISAVPGCYLLQQTSS